MNAGRCDWCLKDHDRLRDVQVEPDKSTGKGSARRIIPGRKIRVGGCCASTVSRSMAAARAEAAS